MDIEEVKSKYKNEWVLAEVLKLDSLGKPTEVKILVHSKNRDDVYDQLDNVETNKHVATFYTGEIPEKGYAVVFYGKNRN